MRNLGKLALLTVLSLLGTATAQEHGRPKRAPPPPSIYSDDHWDYSTRLTTGNFKNIIKQEVDAGRTLFIRFIASSG